MGQQNIYDLIKKSEKALSRQEIQDALDLSKSPVLSGLKRRKGVGKGASIER